MLQDTINEVRGTREIPCRQAEPVSPIIMAMVEQLPFVGASGRLSLGSSRQLSKNDQVPGHSSFYPKVSHLGEAPVECLRETKGRARWQIQAQTIRAMRALLTSRLFGQPWMCLWLRPRITQLSRDGRPRALMISSRMGMPRPSSVC